MILENADFFVRLIDLPPRVGGLVSPNDDGTFNVYLRSDRFMPDLIDDYDHELQHIEEDDFYNDRPIDEIESDSR